MRGRNKILAGREYCHLPALTKSFPEWTEIDLNPDLESKEGGVPSLGLAIHPQCRGQGAGRRLMPHLHERARYRGAATVRLTVSRTNGAAIALSPSLGYRFEPCSETELLGLLSL